jgi:hypothetical protein
VNSVQASCALGPFNPNGVMATTTPEGRADRSAASAGAVTPASMITTSAAAASPSTAASSGVPTIDRFDVFRYAKSAEFPSAIGPPAVQRRIGSPAAGSTLTTSAPASAKSFPA